VLDDVELGGQYGISLDHAGGLAEGEVGHLLRRGHQQELGAGAAVHQQRRDHDSCAGRGLGGLLRDETEKLTDRAGVGRGVVGAEQGTDEIALPCPGGVGQGRAARHVG
jgi:hypothetical protein